VLSADNMMLSETVKIENMLAADNMLSTVNILFLFLFFLEYFTHPTAKVFFYLGRNTEYWEYRYYVIQ
jgi:hypothetical protein